jgi:hypothetical protein
VRQSREEVLVREGEEEGGLGVRGREDTAEERGKGGRAEPGEVQQGGAGCDMLPANGIEDPAVVPDEGWRVQDGEKRRSVEQEDAVCGDGEGVEGGEGEKHVAEANGRRADNKEADVVA